MYLIVCHCLWWLWCGYDVLWYYGVFNRSLFVFNGALWCKMYYSAFNAVFNGLLWCSLMCIEHLLVCCMDWCMMIQSLVNVRMCHWNANYIHVNPCRVLTLMSSCLRNVILICVLLNCHFIAHTCSISWLYAVFVIQPCHNTQSDEWQWTEESMAQVKYINCSLWTTLCAQCVAHCGHCSRIIRTMFALFDYCSMHIVRTLCGQTAHCACCANNVHSILFKVCS